MSRLRLYLIAAFGWAFIFFNTERVISPINLASFVYVLAWFYVFIIMMFPAVYRQSTSMLILMGFVPFFALKVLLGYEIAGTHMPLTVTEMASLGITIFLAREIGEGLETLRREILRLSLGKAGQAANPFQTAQAEFYREIRRARHYNRPAALLSIAPTKESVQLNINRFIQEAQNSIIQQYIVARTSDFLRSGFKETDVVSMRDDHFLVLLPETEAKHLPIVVERIQRIAEDKLGVELKIGAATFPDEALTFESLVQYAEERMKQDAGLPTAAAENPPAPVPDLPVAREFSQTAVVGENKNGQHLTTEVNQPDIRQ